MEATKDINRIKVVLVEKKRTNKWLAEQLGKDPATVSKWCTNTSQPGLETLLQIANVLDVDVKDLLHSTKEDTMYFKVPTGLAYIDVANLTQDNIRKSFDGNLWIITKRQKTNTDVNVPLLDIPKMILKKYKSKLPNGKILPVISNQKLNAYLKEIADVCGIKKNLTFHLTNHTTFYSSLKINTLHHASNKQVTI